MKPIKNRFFCKDCSRNKMLFETEKKAEAFIKFNGDEIEKETGYKPERIYFCDYCNGWHTTSKKEYLIIKSRTEKVLDLYRVEKEKKELKKTESALIRAGNLVKLIQGLDAIEKYIAIIELSKKKLNDYSETLDKAIKEYETIKDFSSGLKREAKRKNSLREKLYIFRSSTK